MTLADSAWNAGPEARQIATLRQENSRLRAQLKDVLVENEELEKVAHLIDRVSGVGVHPPKWLTPKRRRQNSHKAIVCCLLSDTHFDEVVRAEEVHGLNAYNRTIATMRLERWTRKVVELTTEFLAGVEYEGIVVCLGGDIFSGNIHDELRETNEDTLFGSILYWLEQVCGALSGLADVFGSVYVPVVVGNHGRQTRKPRAKLAVRDNADWLLGCLIGNYFAGDDRVVVDVSEAPDLAFDVYGTRHLLTHGDQVKGGGGIGGIWPPIKRMEAKKREREAFDVMVLGHWHQLVQTGGLIVNGAMKGVDEYALNHLNVRPERAQQALWIVTPENGISWQVGVNCEHRKSEGW